MNKPYFVDTTIFLRFLAGGIEEQAQASFTLFKQAREGKQTLTTSEAVIAEVVCVLNKHYEVSRPEVKKCLKPILEIKRFKLPNRSVHLRALDLYEQYSIDFEDCLTVAHIERQQISGLFSYNQDFDKFEHVQRIEPEPLGRP